MTSDGKVVVIGLDGASPELMFDWIKEGELPNLARITDNGVSGELASVFPPVSPTAWASFVTGKNPGKHGILDFEVSLDEGYQRHFVNSSYIGTETLWSILSDAGKKVGIVHMPLTYPAQQVNGFIVSGYALSPAIATYPPELKAELTQEIPGYSEAYSKIYRYVPGRESSYLEDIHLLTDKEAQVTFYLLRNREWDFFMTVFFFLDQIQHFFWMFQDEDHPSYDPSLARMHGRDILRFYQKIDEIVGKLCDETDDDVTVMVMSDHGFGPLHRNVYINHWLMKQRLLRLRTSRNLRDSLSQRLKISRETITRLHRKHRFFQALERMLPRSSVKGIYDHLPTSRFSIDDIDFGQTKAYSTGYVGQIFINLEGREENGIVKPGFAYENLRSCIIKKLLELKDPEDGKNLVDEVFRKEELYSGPYSKHAADIFFIMRDMTYITHGAWTAGEALEFGADLGSFTGPPVTMESGWHRMNGVLMVEGPNVRKGKKIENARLTDLLPTILHIMRVPIPSDVDGRALVEIFNPGSLLAESKARRRRPRLSRRRAYLPGKEEKEIKERLRALGYM